MSANRTSVVLALMVSITTAACGVPRQQPPTYRVDQTFHPSGLPALFR